MSKLCPDASKWSISYVVNLIQKITHLRCPFLSDLLEASVDPQAAAAQAAAHKVGTLY